ncbi:MAG TPA: hypothetical protein VJJ70_13100 [Anaerolineales bacterium]|nr:hypothetical protein [Anaerolineales bacterium]
MSTGRAIVPRQGKDGPARLIYLPALSIAAGLSGVETINADE